MHVHEASSTSSYPTSLGDTKTYTHMKDCQGRLGGARAALEEECRNFGFVKLMLHHKFIDFFVRVRDGTGVLTLSVWAQWCIRQLSFVCLG